MLKALLLELKPRKKTHPKMNPTIVGQDYGDAGTMQTLQAMVSMVNNSYLDISIRDRASQIIRSCGRSRDMQHACFDSFMRQNVNYISDPFDTEVLSEPITFMNQRLNEGRKPYGDCAQISTYLATLLKSVGHQPQFKAIGNPGFFYHVFVVCEGEEIDPTEPVIPKQYERFTIIPI